MDVGGVTRWLESIPESHVKPDPTVAREHHAIVEERMRQMEDKLPGLMKVFAGVKVEMAGSVLSETKIGESDEFDINVVINLPFDLSEVSLNLDDSSPGYASLEVPEGIVRGFEEKYDIFAAKGDTYHVSAGKLSQALAHVVHHDLNMLKERVHEK